ncbi:hypothetical protein CEXT_742001 [Caerostris extrusa]|uniref:Uncharacterized protein n=1 Tax=Caerostris extrusa TaxID=172846 RepID=A0AAV4M7M4_CAEEX|nr:hypothetical protein CEXT_742001 [Caerostris extrusa]
MHIPTFVFSLAQHLKCITIEVEPRGRKGRANLPDANIGGICLKLLWKIRGHNYKIASSLNRGGRLYLLHVTQLDEIGKD